MLAADESAFICDMAETYGVFDYRALPVSTLAALAAGLRDDSRIKMRLTGRKLTRLDSLLAAMVDRLSILVWQNSADGVKGVNRPASILSILLDEPQTSGSNVQGFDTAEEFEVEWARRTGVSHGG